MCLLLRFVVIVSCPNSSNFIHEIGTVYGVPITSTSMASGAPLSGQRHSCHTNVCMSCPLCWPFFAPPPPPFRHVHTPYIRDQGGKHKLPLQASSASECTRWTRTVMSGTGQGGHGCLVPADWSFWGRGRTYVTSSVIFQGNSELRIFMHHLLLCRCGQLNYIYYIRRECRPNKTWLPAEVGTVCSSP